MTPDTREPIRLIQSGLDRLGHSPGSIDGLWGLRTARAMKALLAANGRAASTGTSRTLALDHRGEVGPWPP